MNNFTSYFVAIPIPEQFKDVLFNVAGELKKVMPLAKVLNMSSSHITLYYLIQEAGEELPSVATKVEMLASSLRGGEVRVGSLSTFNNVSPILFLDVNYPAGLKDFNQLLDKVLSRYRAEDNNLPFHPHITIAVIPQGSAETFLKNNKSQVEKLSVNFSFPITEIAIYGADSHTTPEYQERIATIALQ
jgi:2'-5' RNA ligase